MRIIKCLNSFNRNTLGKLNADAMMVNSDLSGKLCVELMQPQLCLLEPLKA